MALANKTARVAGALLTLQRFPFIDVAMAPTNDAEQSADPNIPVIGCRSTVRQAERAGQGICLWGAAERRGF